MILFNPAVLKKRSRKEIVEIPQIHVTRKKNLQQKREIKNVYRIVGRFQFVQMSQLISG